MLTSIPSSPPTEPVSADAPKTKSTVRVAEKEVRPEPENTLSPTVVSLLPISKLTVNELEHPAKAPSPMLVRDEGSVMLPVMPE